MKNNILRLCIVMIFLITVLMPVFSYARGGGSGGFGARHSYGPGGYGIQNQTKSMDHSGCGEQLGSGAKKGKTYGPGDGTGNLGYPPKDGTGYGSPSNR